MLVDDIGDVTITNDGATILKQLEVTHPAAKVLVELSQIQDREVGDGTTSVVILAAELLKRGNELIKNNIHATSVMTGFRHALRESVKFIQSSLSVKVDTLGKDALLNAAKTSMSSKLLNAESDFFAGLVVDAMQNVKTINHAGLAKYPVKAIHVLKTHGMSSKDSQLVDGYAIQATRSAQGMPTSIQGAKIACVDFNLNKYRLAMGVQVLVHDPEALDKIRQAEMDVCKDRCNKIIASGANVVLCSRGIDDFALKYFVEAGVIAIRRVPKNDLKRIANNTGAKVVVSLADIEGEESFEPEALGTCERVYEKRVGDWEYMFFEGMSQTRAQTIILRGANDFFLEEVERSLHDSLCVIKRVLESNSVVAGGGSVEVALSVYLDEYARSLGSREQLAIAEFSEALQIIPKVLSMNAAKDATELLAKLRVYHNAAQKEGGDEQKKAAMKYSGLDLTNGKVRNNLKNGVIEPSMSKVKSLKFATEAAITILRIDDMIKLAPPPQEGQQ
uniref:T-complex protein 1 subunit alpha n=1 Tax=Strombidium inclinatum TaxID=197538 RepID=A0A7S3IYR0_9SPIT